MTNSEKPYSGVDLNPSISEHLKSCPDCGERSKQLGEMIDSLSSHKDIFCPESWELYVLAESGEQPSGLVADHLKVCCTCQTRLDEIRTDLKKDYAIPPVLVEAFRKRFPAPEKSKGFLENLYDLVFSSFKFPALAMATAAAVVFVVVLQSRQQTETFIASSPINWDRSLGISLMAPKKPKAVMVILVQDSPKAWPQEKVDALYEALRPSKETRQHFQFLSPSQLRFALDGSKTPAEKGDLARLIGERLGAGHLFIFTIAKKGDSFELRQDAMNTKTGESLSKIVRQDIKDSELPTALREAAQELTKEAGPSAN